jgi:hypothetical protein
MDDAGHWQFGQGHLVILGDSVDRGRDVFAVLWRLYGLAGQASATGGAVHVVLGNHEQHCLRPQRVMAACNRSGKLSASSCTSAWRNEQPASPADRPRRPRAHSHAELARIAKQRARCLASSAHFVMGSLMIRTCAAFVPVQLSDCRQCQHLYACAKDGTVELHQLPMLRARGKLSRAGKRNSSGRGRPSVHLLR